MNPKRLALMAACGAAAFGSYYATHRFLTVRDKQKAREDILSH